MRVRPDLLSVMPPAVGSLELERRASVWSQNEVPLERMQASPMSVLFAAALALARSVVCVLHRRGDDCRLELSAELSSLCQRAQNDSLVSGLLRSSLVTWRETGGPP